MFGGFQTEKLHEHGTSKWGKETFSKTITDNGLLGLQLLRCFLGGYLKSSHTPLQLEACQKKEGVEANPSLARAWLGSLWLPARWRGLGAPWPTADPRGGTAAHRSSGLNPDARRKSENKSPVKRGQQKYEEDHCFVIWFFFGPPQKKAAQ